MTNSHLVRRFEDEFKNQANLGIVDELMTDGLVHYLPHPGLRAGRDAMRDVGHLVFGAVRDITVTIELMLTDGDLVANRVVGRGRRNDNDAPTRRIEHHIYRLDNGRIAELFPSGGPEIP